MQVPLQITFRNLGSSPAIEENIRAKMAHLERFSDRITACHVVIEGRNHRHRQGTLYNCAIHLDLPGRNISVGHVGPKDHAHEDVYVAIRDAFNAAARSLEDHTRILRGDVKVHIPPLHGKVARLNPDGYGFIELVDGQEIYFHANSVLNGGFAHLALGQEVRLAVDEKEGEKGPQASMVAPLGKHHDVGERA